MVLGARFRTLVTTVQALLTCVQNMLHSCNKLATCSVAISHPVNGLTLMAPGAAGPTTAIHLFIAQVLACNGGRIGRTTQFCHMLTRSKLLPQYSLTEDVGEIL